MMCIIPVDLLWRLASSNSSLCYFSHQLRFIAFTTNLPPFAFKQISLYIQGVNLSYETSISLLPTSCCQYNFYFCIYYKHYNTLIFLFYLSTIFKRHLMNNNKKKNSPEYLPTKLTSICVGTHFSLIPLSLGPRLNISWGADLLVMNSFNLYLKIYFPFVLGRYFHQPWSSSMPVKLFLRDWGFFSPLGILKIIVLLSFVCVVSSKNSAFILSFIPLQQHVFLPAIVFKIFLLLFLKEFIHVFLEREEGREKERERNIDVRENHRNFTSRTPPAGDLARNSGMRPDQESNSDLTVCGPMPSPLSHTSRGLITGFESFHRDVLWCSFFLVVVLRGH